MEIVVPKKNDIFIGKVDGMERKELSLFTTIDPSLSILINFNLTGHRRNFYTVMHKIGILNSPFV